MTLPEIKTHFHYSRQQRKGLLLLFAAITVLQLLYFFADFTKNEKPSHEKQQWLALQVQIDSLKKQKRREIPKIYPFNPNFITDFKGYKLGMSAAEIDRLLAFRKTGKYVGSASEFQSVTKIPDALLNAISPYFKFPDWVKNRKSSKERPKPVFDQKEKMAVRDINQATRADLMKIYGIGPALSERILKEKEKFGGFVSMEQMNDIWGLPPEVIESLNKYFRVSALPEVVKININRASVKELAAFPYFRYALAKQIVTFRSMNGAIHNPEDLAKINGFPVEKIEIIALYLEF